MENLMSGKAMAFFEELGKLCKKHKVENITTGVHSIGEIIGFKNEWCYFKYNEGDGIDLQKTYKQSIKQKIKCITLKAKV